MFIGPVKRMRLGKHIRFLIAAGLGAAAGALSMTLPISTAARFLVAVDMFSVVYILSLLQFARHVTPVDLRRHAAETDEGLPLILAMALGAVFVSLAAIFLVLNKTGGPELGETILALFAVPINWAMVHALLALHYAHLYYAPDDAGSDAGGVTFSETPDPSLWDFFYFSYGIGMTAQVSDVTVQSAQIRRSVLLHSIGSFFYNTVILALAVNAAMTLDG
jgi:uncharacterized membrane protein